MYDLLRCIPVLTSSASQASAHNCYNLARVTGRARSQHRSKSKEHFLQVVSDCVTTPTATPMGDTGAAAGHCKEFGACLPFMLAAQRAQLYLITQNKCCIWCFRQMRHANARKQRRRRGSANHDPRSVTDDLAC